MNRSPHHLANQSYGVDGLRRFSREEDGAAYTLSFVMVMPIYALLMCLIVEAALMLTAKLGTVYAAFAAARSASVWSSATTWHKAQKKAQLAAVKSMVPFASGTQSIVSSIPTNLDGAPNPLAFWGAYQAYAKDPVAEKYLLAKYAYALANVKVTIDGPPAKSADPIKVKVTYRFPFNVPGIGRILGEAGPGGYYFPIASEVTIPNEGPRDDRKTIGIGYGILD
jgi:Flp pilus assembly protein TadG